MMQGMQPMRSPWMDMQTEQQNAPNTPQDAAKMALIDAPMASATGAPYSPQSSEGLMGALQGMFGGLGGKTSGSGGEAFSSIKNAFGGLGK